MAEDNSIGCGYFVLLLCIGIGVFLLKSHEEEVARENPYRWRGVVCPNQRLAVAPFLELKKSKRSFRTREALYFQ